MRVIHSAPVGHGELLVDPPFDRWRALAEKNHRAGCEWDVRIAGVPLATLREQARGETLREASAYSAVLGVSVQDAPSAPGLVVVTGHQPELYHPGVWVKCFLAQRFSDETGAAALDIVVDSDTFDKVALETPCLKRGVGRCESVLARGGADVPFACAPPPSVEEVRAFRSEGLAGLQTLPAPSLARHFCLFVDELEAAIVRANNLADAITIARRRYEAPAGTRYLELPVTRQARTQAFTRLVAHIALDAEHFAAVHNAELATYRRETGARSSAQPFPDLRAEHDAVELPFWWVAASGRRPLWVQTSTPALLVDGEVVLALDRDPELTHRALLRAGLPIAPRALTLTLFERLFVADLFIHGVGGGRYDQVTDAVIASYLGIEPPHFAVASLTLLLPLGGHEVTDDEIASAEQRLNRLRHNPDQLLGEIEFDTAEDRHHALALADEKRQLVQAIAQEGADKKMIGRRIREINEELAMLMSPLAEQAAADVERLRAQRETAEVLRDRSYPFCLWDPREVADKVR